LLSAGKIAAPRIDVGETHARVEDADVARPTLRQVEIGIDRSLGGREIVAGECETTLVVQHPHWIVAAGQTAELRARAVE